MRRIDDKYHIENNRIVNSATGEILPEDEPLILFRGKDKFVLPMLGSYRRLCERASTQAHINGIIANEFRMRRFAESNPARMKVPD